jgi:HEAT repeat protein
MNRKLILAVGATLIVISLVIVLWQEQNTEKISNAVSPHVGPASQPQASTEESSTLTLAPSASGSKSFDTQHKEDVRTGMKALFEGLKQKGILREVALISQQLQDATETKDSATWSRAFQDAIYSPSARMGEAISAIKPYLNSPESYVRYLAAEALLRVGDQSGIEILLALIQSDEATPQGKQDLRLSSAHLLARFGVASAEAAIFDLYKKTSGSGLLSSLSQLRSERVKEVFQGNGYYENRHSIERYGVVGAEAFVPQITKTFEQTSDPSEKNAAAWSLARITGSEQYVNVLSKAALPAIERKQKGSLSYDDSTKALRYLGSVQSPQAVKVLEQALDSQNPVAVQYATVNLLFNQLGGSQKAEQLVIRELESSPKMLGTELAMQIASKSDNPQVRAAAQSYAKRTASDRWRYWGVERADWPVQNWIYDYAVTLDKPRGAGR